MEWDTPEVNVSKDFEHSAQVVRADPNKYIQKYGKTLKQPKELPRFAHECKPPNGMVLAASQTSRASNRRHSPSQERQIFYELVGDVDALKLIDLDKEGLSEYKPLLRSRSKMVTAHNSRRSKTIYNSNRNYDSSFQNSSFDKSVTLSVSSTCLSRNSSRNVYSSKSSKACITYEHY